MTFDEWYNEYYGVYPDEVIMYSDAYYQMSVSRIAWEASRENLRVSDI